MIILGLNAYHGDAAACLVADGQLIAAVEEERFRRVKHWAGMPTEAIRACLEAAGVGLEAVEHIAINRNPRAHVLEKALYAFATRPSLAIVKDRLKNASKMLDVATVLEARFGVDAAVLKHRVRYVEHHRAHLGSAFFVAPFQRAAIASVDGFGDFVSTMTGVGEGTGIRLFDHVTFPHSLGLFYLAMTQFLGFPTYGDEYKVMGLAACGKPEYLDQLRQIVRVKPRGRFELDLEYFRHHSEGIAMTWEDGEPVLGRVYSDKWVQQLGPPRPKEEEIAERHENLAASLQAMYEEVFFHILEELAHRAKTDALCLAGGCALNSVANGRILTRTPFRRVYIPPAAGDAGGAVGAAYSVWHEKLGRPRSFVMDRADWGPEYDQAEVEAEIGRRRGELAEAGCRIEHFDDEQKLCRWTAERIAQGKIVGWFQGRMEWGSRALGHRSIVADPRRPGMKDVLNARIKRREPFRPFAPSILEEAVPDYFEQREPSPFMTMTYQVRPEKRDIIPAPTHVDGTGRLQTVSRQSDPLYWSLINEFAALTGVPALLNTSFNENEPIVCNPSQALDCFLRTKMDVLVLGHHAIEALGRR